MAVRLDHGDDQLSEVHEINVTPFIDVILVLLIIFMIAAPLATVDISVDLPASSAERTPRPEKPLFLTLKSDLSVSLDNDTINRAALAPANLARAAPSPSISRRHCRARCLPRGPGRAKPRRAPRPGSTCNITSLAAACARAVKPRKAEAAPSLREQTTSRRRQSARRRSSVRRPPSGGVIGVIV